MGALSGPSQIGIGCNPVTNASIGWRLKSTRVQIYKIGYMHRYTVVML
jgi:hypothetical protein